MVFDRVGNFARHCARKVVPQSLRVKLIDWRGRQASREMAKANKVRSAQDVFTEIYASKAWGGTGDEFFSGTGSTDHATLSYIDVVNDFIKANGIESLVDLGCGDFSVGGQLNVADYTGIDIVEPLIARNNATFGNEHRRFVSMDASEAEALPKADLCLVRQVFQHMSNDQIARVLPKLAHFRFLLVTEHHPADADFQAYNLDKVHGADTRVFKGSGVYLDQPPFNATVSLITEHQGFPGRVDVHARGWIRTYLVNPPN